MTGVLIRRDLNMDTCKGKTTDLVLAIVLIFLGFLLPICYMERLCIQVVGFSFLNSSLKTFSQVFWG